MTPVPADTRAQSEMVGVLLLAAVVVLTVGTLGVAAFDHVRNDETTRADVSVLVTHDGVGITHGGGSSVPLSALRVVVRNDSATWEPSVAAAGVVDGDDDGVFEPGERWVGRRELGESKTTVYVVDTRTGSLLDKKTAYPTRRQRLTSAPSVRRPRRLP